MRRRFPHARIVAAVFARPPPAKAVEYLARAIALDEQLTTAVRPELALAYFNLGVSLNREGKPEAEKAFHEAELREPKYVALRMEYKANSGPATGNGPRPYVTGKPITRDPKLAGLYRQAVASHQQGQLDLALDEFTMLLRTDPKCAEAWLGRGAVFLEKNDPESAIGDVNRRSTWTRIPRKPTACAGGHI